MTSKNFCSDVKLLRFKLSKSAWILTLYSIILFFAVTVSNTLRIQEVKERLVSHIADREQYILKNVTGLFTLDNKVVLFLSLRLRLSPR